MNKVNEEIRSFIVNYHEIKEQIKEIETEAEQDYTIWHQTINDFNVLFDLPISISIKNVKESILGIKLPVLDFKYKDHYVDEEVLVKNVLSTGEKRALYLLYILFDLINLVNTNQDKLIVLDDVADAFDYQNKHALLEYIAKISENSNFVVILLTNNFNFFRNGIQLSDRKYSYLTLKVDDVISFETGKYMKNIFLSFLKNINSNDDYLISCIPFARNLHEFRMDNNPNDYKLYYEYSNLLHYRTHNRGYTLSRLCKTLKKSFGIKVTIVKSDESYYKFILNHAKKIAKLTSNQSEIEKKIVLAIGIRLCMDKLLLTELGKLDKDFDPKKWDSETKHLIEKYKRIGGKKKLLDIIDRGKLLTPEIIHLNSFNIDPLIDVQISRLKILYKEILIQTPWRYWGLKK